MDLGAYKSPGKKHSFDFIFEGQIRFGPDYFKIQLDSNLITDRLFGFEFKWDAESKYLALQEWLTTDYRKGPTTALTIIDLENGKIARVKTVEKAFIIPLEFVGDVIKYEIDQLSIDKKQKFQISLKKVKNWEG